MYHCAFVLDQQVGLKTQALNLEQAAKVDPEIRATFVPVRYETPAGLLSRLPGVPRSIKGTLRGVREIRQGLGNGGQFDAVLWATWAAKSVPDLVKAAPAFLVMDMTPTQMEAMGQHYNYTRSRARFAGGWKRRATAQLYERATHLFPWNQWVAQSLRDDWGVPQEKITPVSPGVDTTRFYPVSDDQRGSMNDPVRVLFVGGDFERKGGDLLLRWLQNRKAGDVPVELHVVTRSEDQTLDTVPGVFVHRNISNNSPELARLYRQSDLFALPTRADCYSLVALEAMASGLPVVISRLGGIPEIVEEGVTGHLIEPDDYEGLAGSLNTLVSDRKRLRTWGDAGRTRACTHFDCQLGTQTMFALMKQLAQRNA